MIAGSRAATMATIPALGFGLLFSGPRNVESFEPAVAGTFLLTAIAIVLLANRLQKARSRMADSQRRNASGAAHDQSLADELNPIIAGATGTTPHHWCPDGTLPCQTAP